MDPIVILYFSVLVIALTSVLYSKNTQKAHRVEIYARNIKNRWNNVEKTGAEER